MVGKRRSDEPRLTAAGIALYWPSERSFDGLYFRKVDALPVEDRPGIEAPDPLDLYRVGAIKWRELPAKGWPTDAWVQQSLEKALHDRDPVLIDYLERCYEAAEAVGRPDAAAGISHAFATILGRDLSRESTVEINAPDIEHDDFKQMEVRVGLDSATRARIEAIRTDGWKDALSALGVRELRIPQAELEQGGADSPGSTVRVRPVDEIDRETSMLGLRAGERPDLELIIGRDCAYVAWGPYISDRIRFDDPAIAFDESHDASARGDIAARMNDALTPAHCVLRALGAEDAEEGTRCLNEVQALADRLAADDAPDDEISPVP